MNPSTSWEELHRKGKLRAVTKTEERVQTYRYRLTLECGHTMSRTRSAAKRGQLPKRIRCYHKDCKEPIR